MNLGRALGLFVVGLGTVACSTEDASSGESDVVPVESMSQTGESTEMQVTTTPVVQERVSVTLNWLGGGGGNVIANPPLLACGATSDGVQLCTFPNGVEVTLTAEPLSGSRFLGWGGACADAGTSDSCVVRVDGETSIDVLFD